MQKGIIFVPFMTGKGGTETVIHNLFQAVNNNQNFELKVYSIGGSIDYGWTEGGNVAVQEISSKRIIRTLYYLTCLPQRISKIVKKEKPDFIISTNPVMWFLSKQVVKRLKKTTPVIAWYHYSLKQKPIKKLFLNSADYYLAISSGIKHQLMELGISGERIFLIYNPTDSDFHKIERPKDKVHFIYLGRVDLDKQKNVKELLLGLQDVKGDWVLDIYGDDKASQPIKQLAHELEIDNRISWKGFVSEPWKAISNATALLLTSNYEGLPMVLVEAISHGIYCVSSDIATGPDDIIKNGVNGMLYPPHNISDLTNILQSIVNAPLNLPEQSQIIASSEKFSLKNYGTYFSNAISSIVG